MNHSYDDISHTKHRNKLKETFDNVFTSMNQKINQEGGIQSNFLINMLYFHPIYNI